MPPPRSVHPECPSGVSIRSVRPGTLPSTLRSIIQERALPSITMTEDGPNSRPARGPGSDGASNEPRGTLMGGAGSREDFGSPQWRSPGPPDADSDATQEIPGFGGQWRDSAGQDRP